MVFCIILTQPKNINLKFQITNYQLVKTSKQNQKPIYYRHRDKIIHVNVKIKSPNKCYFNNNLPGVVEKDLLLAKSHTVKFDLGVAWNLQSDLWMSFRPEEHPRRTFQWCQSQLDKE